jgi:hypothetical protein
MCLALAPGARTLGRCAATPLGRPPFAGRATLRGTVASTSGRCCCLCRVGSRHKGLGGTAASTCCRALPLARSRLPPCAPLLPLLWWWCAGKQVGKLASQHAPPQRGIPVVSCA